MGELPFTKNAERLGLGRGAPGILMLVSLPARKELGALLVSGQARGQVFRGQQRLAL